MKLPSLWSKNQDLVSDPFRAIRRDFEDMFRAGPLWTWGLACQRSMWRKQRMPSK
jgi:hypothetical protein